MLHSRLLPAADKSSRQLLVVLHGLGDSGAGFEWLPRALQLPGMNYLLVNAPEPYFGGYSWFDIAGDWGPKIRQSRELLAALLDAQHAAGYPSGLTTLFGFSQGCVMTLETGFRYPRRFAGLVGVSGAIPDPKTLLAEKSAIAGQQRMLFTHGSYDEWFVAAQVEAQVKQLRAGGLQIAWREFPKNHTIDMADELPLIRQFILAGYQPETA